jgi:GTPase SAR1 family protein
MKFAQLVIGPAGAGKSTYCETVKAHCDALGRPASVVNLDPAAEEFKYPVAADVRELVTLEDAMAELGLGPNGGLLFCMEHLEEHLDEWLGEALGGYGDEDYLLLDCPGQVELYSHLGVFPAIVSYLRREGWTVAAVYCLDAQFAADAPKFIAGCLAALSAMAQLELPHLNVLTKMDLVPDRARVEEECLFPDGAALRRALDASTGARFAALNAAVAALLDDFSMVAFSPLDVTDEESVEALVATVDGMVQYGEDADVRTREMGEFPDQEAAGGEGGEGADGGCDF